jgi:dolichol-phosphate mannosyltransferase
MFELLKEGHDVVIGSRYAPGASIAGWPMKRLIISKIVTLLLRVMLRVPVTDPLSGFVGVRTPEILTNDIKYANYKFLLELIVATKSLRIKETPILFTDRHKGESKLSLRVARNFLELVLRLLVRNLIGFARSH